MQGVVPDDALHVRVFCGAVKPDFQPFRFFQDVYLLFMQFRHFKFIIFPIDAKIQKISIASPFSCEKDEKSLCRRRDGSAVRCEGSAGAGCRSGREEYAESASGTAPDALSAISSVCGKVISAPGAAAIARPCGAFLRAAARHASPGGCSPAWDRPRSP